MPKKIYVDEFYLTNIKKIKQLEGKVNGRHFAVVGPNGAGKTTIFQVIRRLLAALPDTKKPEIWVTKGEQAGDMGLKVVNNGDVYFVNEKHSAKTGARSRIRLWKETGERRDELTPAQERLQEIFGNVLDLTPIMDMTGKQQFEFLVKNLNIDTSGYKKNRDVLVSKRSAEKGKKTIINSVLKEHYVSDDDIVKYADEKNIEEVLAKKVDVVKLNEVKEDQLKVLEELDTSKERIAEIDTTIKQMQEAIKKLQEEKAALNVSLKDENKYKKQLNAIVEDIRKAEKTNKQVDEEIKTLSEHNVKHNAVVYFKQKQEELKKVEQEFKNYNEQVQALDDAFFRGLAQLPFGEVYEGLKLYYQEADEENNKEEMIGLYLDELPFNTRQLSYGLMIKCLIKLATFLNPDGLNFVYIQHWLDLDENNQNDLLQFAEKQGNVQLGIEKVDNRAEVAIEFIEIKDKPKKQSKKNEPGNAANN